MNFAHTLNMWSHTIHRDDSVDAPVSYGNNPGVHSEKIFTEMLLQERKRCKRTKKSFLLLLLNIEEILRENSASENIGTLFSLLLKSTRETDYKGWYKCDAVIGVVFTEVRDSDIALIKAVVAKNLEEHLATDVRDKIAVSYHLFPERLDDVSARSLDPNIYPDLSKRSISSLTEHFFKRFTDIIGSIAGLIIFLPLFLIIPVLIKVSSKGPVFFVQKRIGQFGVPFNFIKFRSMYIDNDPTSHREYVTSYIQGAKMCNRAENPLEKGPVYKIVSDPRVTSVGRFLRKSSLDEIPQFLNVLMGDMSLVGPRPPIPYEFEKYETWHRERLLSIKPGITGLWQVNGRSSTTFDDMVRLDVRYIREWSLWLDALILFKTPWVVVAGKGAY